MQQRFSTIGSVTFFNVTQYNYSKTNNFKMSIYILLEGNVTFLVNLKALTNKQQSQYIDRNASNRMKKRKKKRNRAIQQMSSSNFTS